MGTRSLGKGRSFIRLVQDLLLHLRQTDRYTDRQVTTDRKVARRSGYSKQTGSSRQIAKKTRQAGRYTDRK